MTPFQVDSIISISGSGYLYLLVLSFRQWSLLQNGCILFNFFPISLACKRADLLLHLCPLCGSMWEVQWDTTGLWAFTPNSWNVVHTKLSSNHKPILLYKKKTKNHSTLKPNSLNVPVGSMCPIGRYFINFFLLYLNHDMSCFNYQWCPKFLFWKKCDVVVKNHVDKYKINWVQINDFLQDLGKSLGGRRWIFKCFPFVYLK